MKKKGLSEIKLKKIIAKWKKIFLLNSWKIRLKIVEFKRKDYRQSGDIKIDLKKKEAVLLLSSNPFRDEESVIVHELIHLLLWDWDVYSEKTILKNCKKFDKKHNIYLRKLENTVGKLTTIFLKLKTGR